jgi:hypothetical protein
VIDGLLESGFVQDLLSNFVADVCAGLVLGSAAALVVGMMLHRIRLAQEQKQRRQQEALRAIRYLSDDGLPYGSKESVPARYRGETESEFAPRWAQAVAGIVDEL